MSLDESLRSLAEGAAAPETHAKSFGTMFKRTHAKRLKGQEDARRRNDISELLVPDGQKTTNDYPP